MYKVVQSLDILLTPQVPSPMIGTSLPLLNLTFGTAIVLYFRLLFKDIYKYL